MAAAQQEPEEWERLRIRAIIDQAAGRYAESEAALHELIAKHQVKAAYRVALVYAARGELDLALAWLERAHGQRDPKLGQMKTQPLLHPLHGDPRGSTFLRKIGFDD